MPFTLHPSGYCVWFNESSRKNLVPGLPCPECGKTAGHTYTCKYFQEKEGSNSRSKLYNATAILWAKSQRVNFWTFTLPSADNSKIFQRSPGCEITGDLAITATFSKMLESVAVKVKREAPPNCIGKFSYVWVSEAQMKRQEKFGGIGDLHFHLLTSNFIDIQWAQSQWNSYFPDAVYRNSVHVDPVPKNVKSIPAYMCKYLGKGSQRYIVSRRFSCSRDLSCLAPIRLNYLPSDLQAITTKIVQAPNGYESCLYYFNTGQILKRYGKFMAAEKEFEGTRGGKLFTAVEIESRRFTRERAESIRKYNRENGIIEF